MTKRCRHCRAEKGLDQFSPDPRGVSGRHAYCKACNNELAKARRLRDPEWAKGADRFGNLRRFGLRPTDYEALLTKQRGKCAGCGTSDPGNGQKNFQVDHDHNCCPGPRSCGQCVRGLLCGSCNSALGYVKDDPDRLAALASYLLRRVDVLRSVS